MKKFVGDFLHRGFVACGFGPIAWAIVMYILSKNNDTVQTIPATEAVLSILTSSLLAFVAGGINAIYKIERIPLVLAIFIHAVVLYIDYIVIYLVNGWIEAEITILTVFTICFFSGFAIIWAIIYFTTKKSTDRLNKKLVEQQKESKESIKES